MKKVTFFSVFITFFSLTIISCHDDHNHDHDHDAITTVELKLVNGDETITLISKDLDGDGPNAPQVTVSGPLKKSTIYTGTIRFLNELENPTKDVTEEIVDESNAHQVFYIVSNNLGSFQYSDFDSNGKPLGLSTVYVSENAGLGNLRVVLRHLPNKNASGVAEGNIANARGETDIEVNFNIVLVD